MTHDGTLTRGPVRTPRGLLRVFALALWVVTLILAGSMLVIYRDVGHLGLDAHAYWSAAHRENMYAQGPGHRDAYLYSPAFLQLIGPLTLLPWPAFFGAWMLLQGLCFWWLTRPLGPWWQWPVLFLCFAEILYGNIHGLLGVMVVLGFRRPGLWAFALLTKVTLGAVGVVWFLARRDWRALAELGLVATVVVGLSVLVDVTAWQEWIGFLSSSSDQESATTRTARVAVVLVLVAVAAVKDWRWAVPLTMLAAAPRFSVQVKDLSLLAATVRLATQSAASRRRTRGATSSP